MEQFIKTNKSNFVNANFDCESLDVDPLLEEFCNCPAYDASHLSAMMKLINATQHVAYSSRKKISEPKRAICHSDSHFYVTHEHFVTAVTMFGTPSIQWKEVRGIHCSMYGLK